MQPLPDKLSQATFQAQFHQRWNHLDDPHVRSLAWLLDAPDLLDKDAPQWQGKIAHIAAADDGGYQDTAGWLQALESEPAQRLALHAFIGSLASTRLGLYAEKLMAFYFQQQHILVAHGLQVRGGNGGTVGEFDFLLRQPGGLVHWEFATKFYLLESAGASLVADDFVGPNLSDSLGEKIQKIFCRQLVLSQHPAAQDYLTEPVVAAQALVKGWLFYRDQDYVVPGALGVSDRHCRGYWCPLSLLEVDDAGCYLILSRLNWLAPAKAPLKDALSGAELRQALHRHFSHDRSPLMLATLFPHGDQGLELGRGFVVPEDRSTRAAATRHPAAVTAVA